MIYTQLGGAPVAAKDAAPVTPMPVGEGRDRSVKAMMAKILLISGMVCASLSGCNKVDEATITAAISKLPQSAGITTLSKKASPQPVDHQARIDQLKNELCDDCGPESSECEVEDLYEFPQDGKAPKRLIAFSSPGGGSNSSYTVILSTKEACTPVVEESGTSINFVPTSDKNDFPDIAVTGHWSVEESVDTGYHWDGQKYVSEGAVKKNARTGAEEILHMK